VGKSINLGQLGAELKKVLAAEQEFIKANGEKAVRIAAIKTFSKIIKMTPVGNPDLWKTENKPEGYVGGRARSNWFIGESVSSRVTDSTKSKGAGYVVSALPKTLLGDKTYLYNNLPYIQALEFGHSTQAPAGMVRVSLMGWDRVLNKAFKDLKWHT
jgi:hypothetical protein